LRINITGQDEIGGQNPSEEPSQESSQKETIVTPASLLNEVMKGKKITFEQVKSKLKKEGFKDADVLSSLEEIPKVKIFELIERIKNYSQC
jgi:hypothetical protein